MDEYERCLKHGQSEILFCCEVGCQKTICILCLSEFHLGHKVESLKNEKIKILGDLQEIIEITMKQLSEWRKTESKKQLTKDKDNTPLIERQKEQLDFDTTIAHIENQENELTMSALSVKEEDTYTDLRTKLDTVRRIREKAPRIKKYDFSENVADHSGNNVSCLLALTSGKYYIHNFYFDLLELPK